MNLVVVSPCRWMYGSNYQRLRNFLTQQDFTGFHHPFVCLKRWHSHSVLWPISERSGNGSPSLWCLLVESHFAAQTHVACFTSCLMVWLSAWPFDLNQVSRMESLPLNRWAAHQASWWSPRVKRPPEWSALGTNVGFSQYHVNSPSPRHQHK